jgi:hypothetical protein
MTTSTQTQLRRGTTSQVNAMTPVVGEVVVDTTLSQPCVGDGATAGGIKVPNAAMIQKQTYTYPTVGGTGDAITLTNSPVAAAYVAGQKFTFKAGAANTTATTVNVDGLGAKNVKKMHSGALAALVANDIISGGTYDIIYDGTQFQIKGLTEGPYTSGAMVYLGTQTASSSATIDLTSLLSSTYDDYIIVLDNVLPATGATDLRMRFSIDNSTFDGTNGNYRWQLDSMDDTGIAITGSSGTSGPTTSYIQIGKSQDNGSTSGLSGRVYLHNVNSSSIRRYCTIVASYHNSAGPNFVNANMGAAWLNTANALEAVRFLFSSGNITSGTFKVYGIAKS